MSSIEWTDETWNPMVGCSRVSPGCDGCYAVGVAHRAMQPAHKGLTDVVFRPEHPRARRDGALVDWTGEVRLLPDRLDTPLRWRKPRRVFVDSMSDLFHPDVPEEFIDRVFATMLEAEQHTFQVLTKRPQRMAQLLGTAAPFYLPNVWLGTSVENQRYADLRIPYLLATPAAVRFLSIEPLLGPVDLRAWLCTCGTADDDFGVHDEFCAWRVDRPRIDWVIVGGESGPGARPMHPQWVRDLRDQCITSGVPFFFKQWGEWLPTPVDPTHRVTIRGGLFDNPAAPAMNDEELIRRVGKKAAGRTLDARSWDEFPT